jgi:XapX domain-containing protein
VKAYVVSLTVGLAVGVLYGLLHVRSPAPPVVALVGLFGILVGEQIPPLLQHALTKTPVASVWNTQVRPHVFGRLPHGQSTSENSS